jgi:hypothetical protein
MLGEARVGGSPSMLSDNRFSNQQLRTTEELQIGINFSVFQILSQKRNTKKREGGIIPEIGAGGSNNP